MSGLGWASVPGAIGVRGGRRRVDVWPAGAGPGEAWRVDVWRGDLRCDAGAARGVVAARRLGPLDQRRPRGLAGMPRRFRLDLADRLLERQPLARDLGFVERRLHAAQLRHQRGRARS